MGMFRAVPTARLQEFYPPLTTKRVPSNVPYLVDNIWEWLRPKGGGRYPSRRTATYASPTRALALIGAGAPENGHGFAVGRLVAHGDVVAVQLQVSDARDHVDVKALPKIVMACIGQAWVDSPLTEKQSIAALFLPAVDPDDVEAAFDRIPRGRELRKTLQERSTFWRDAVRLPSLLEEPPSDSGEIFLTAANGYFLNTEVRSSLTQEHLHQWLRDTLKVQVLEHHGVMKGVLSLYKTEGLTKGMRGRTATVIDCIRRSGFEWPGLEKELVAVEKSLNALKREG